MDLYRVGWDRQLLVGLFIYTLISHSWEDKGLNVECVHIVLEIKVGYRN
jgi:hypothetical protein